MTAKHQQPTDETHEWVALYALGALAAEEKAAFEDHLRDCCPVCESDLRSFENVVGQLGFAKAPQTPSTSLRQRLLDHVQRMLAGAEAGAGAVGNKEANQSPRRPRPHSPRNETCVSVPPLTEL